MAIQSVYEITRWIQQKIWKVSVSYEKFSSQGYLQTQIKDNSFVETIISTKKNQNGNHLC